MENAFSVEAWGGATYDTAYRFLKRVSMEEIKIIKTTYAKYTDPDVTSCIQCCGI